jgi:iron(III) transport system ATP-binding protein
MKIEIKKLVKDFGSNRVIDGVSLEIQSGELFFLLGPSGCGKTTVLRTLAGFYEPDGGEILFNSKSMLGVPPHKRNTALVFQNYAIWPHMTVFENVAYGLRVRGVSAAEISERVENALERVKMSSFASRKPSSLSGGQQQRVALARAMVVNPHALLFDEPLSNLDARLRLEMRDEIKRLQAETKITSLYVTHDQEEALSLAHRIGVMNKGVLEQVGTPFEIYNKPASAFVASFIGEINLLPASCLLAQQLSCAIGGDDSTVGFRPERVQLGGDGILGRVIFSSYLGSKNEVTLESRDGTRIKAWLQDYVKEGDEVRFHVESEYLLQFQNKRELR